MAKIFIGIPHLNRPHYLRETLESVLNQTFQDFRIIVSDDCSAPEAVRQVKSYIEELGDDRVSFNQLPEKGGEYGQGWYFYEQAAGHTYFMILHDDDVLKSEDYLERGIRKLSEDESLAYFFANPIVMNAEGEFSAEKTEEYLVSHGRKNKSTGEFDVLTGHMQSGFTPICGTLFRFSALVDSGYVDPDIEGISPFEPNIFVRLGERGAKGWFCSDQLIAYRFHDGSSRVYHHLLENPLVIDGMLKLYARRSFTGENEKLRRKFTSRWYRARMLVNLKKGNWSDARRDLKLTLKENKTSVKAWILAPWVFLTPGLLKAVLPGLPDARNSPEFEPEEN